MSVRNIDLQAPVTVVAGAAKATEQGGQIWSLIAVGAFVGTYVLEGSVDGLTFAPYSPAVSITAPGVYQVVATAPFIRINCTAYTSGTPKFLMHMRNG